MQKTIRSYAAKRLAQHACTHLPEPSALTDTVSQTFAQNQSNSIIVFDQYASKHTIPQIKRNVQDTGDSYIVLLDADIHTDAFSSLKAIYRQLSAQTHSDHSTLSLDHTMGFSDLLKYILDILSPKQEETDASNSREHINSLESEITAFMPNNNINKPITFILNNFHGFCEHPKQKLIYNLFDLTQSQTTTSPLLVICITGRYN